MKVQEQLKQFLDAAPDVSLVAFGDLSSNLILNWSSKTQCPREVLDLLGEKAADCFALFRAEALPAGVDPDVFGASAIHFSERQSQLFARDPASAEDVICAISAPGARLEPVLRSVLALSDKIASAP